MIIIQTFGPKYLNYSKKNIRGNTDPRSEYPEPNQGCHGH